LATKKTPLITVNNQKQLFLVIVVLLGIGSFFWTQSRYPALDEKALMTGSITTSGIGFDIWIPIAEDFNVFQKIGANTVNWYYTNWKGMTFGILFAVALMMLFSLLQNFSSKNRFLNAFSGMLLGAPLGVCVNCAAPIAQGVSRGGAKVETTLAMMLSSPSLNAIVLGMLFSLFPFYIALIKIVFTAFIILICVPLLSKYLVTSIKSENSLNKIQDQSLGNVAYPFLNHSTEVNLGWGQAFYWLLNSYAKGLWYIVRTTLPLMLLAGLLGSIVITLLPWETFVTFFDNESLVFQIGLLILVALIGVFLPVPMSFDVIIVSVLFSAGLPIHLCVVLLCTLGIFSIYSFLIVQQALSKKIAISLLLVISVFGLLAGGIANKTNSIFEKKYDVARKMFSVNMKIFPTILKSADFYKPNQFSKAENSKRSVSVSSEMIFESKNISVRKVPFKSNSNFTDVNKHLFSHIEGWEIGVDPPYTFSLLNVIQPYSDGRGIASGDINLDGFADLLIVSDEKLYLYYNQDGKEFTSSSLAFNNIDTSLYIANAALVDINNDNFLDIVFTTYWHGNYILYSNKGEFYATEARKLPNPNGALLSTGMSFGDVDKDGDLDILLGNFSLGGGANRTRVYETSKDLLLINEGQKWEAKELSKMSGETLSTLFTDFNNDGHLDGIIGIDFNYPDLFYEGNGSSNLKLLKQSDWKLENMLYKTMSVATADIDNDLVAEIYFTQVSDSDFETALVKAENQDDFIQVKRIQEKVMLKHAISQKQQFNRAFGWKDANACADSLTYDCVAATTLSRIQFDDNRSCNYFNDNWRELKRRCNVKYGDSALKTNPAALKDYVMEVQQSKRNALFKLNSETGVYEEKASSFGIDYTGWSWNGKFEDYNNDGWKDLFVVNGYTNRMRTSQESNVFFLNQNGQSFQEATETAGLINYLPTHAYTSVDLNNDGALDIVSVPAIGPISFYYNQTHANKSIQFQLIDEVGNKYGIGSKVYINYGEDSTNSQMKELQLGGGFRSFDISLVHFGLGNFDQVEAAMIVWSTGDTTHIKVPLKAGSTYQLTRKAVQQTL
tara:strand:+ start:4444 stop:7638 length:3195 start_codon:yes stop_codon:yes gene_type:complete